MKSFQTKLKAKLMKARGFTLLELVVVIAIIGILAVIVLPNFIQALAKARDAKKMTELRGVQTFLTTNGIDTALRYPKESSVLITWMKDTGNRVPSAFTNDVSSVYRYVGLNCDNITKVVVAGKEYGPTLGETCSSYQLWTELEVDNAALRLDADLIVTQADSTKSTGPSVLISSIYPSGSVPTTIPTGGTAGDIENCTNAGPADCVFDLVP